MDVSLIGTGLMGRPMAERLLAEGHQVTVYNRTREKAAPLAERGARLAASAAEALSASEATLLMLQDGPAIRALLGAAPLPDLAGRTVIQMSTIGPQESLELAADIEASGGAYLEAPVLGSTPQAAKGELLVIAGGPLELFERWRGLLTCFGPEVRRVGEVGQAAAVKLAFNQMIACQAATFSLALGMVRRRGVDLEAFLEILRRSGFYSRSFDAKLPRMRARDFADPNFPARLLLKDVDLALAEARGLGLATSPLEGVRQVVEATLELGLGEGDYSALYAAVDPE